MSITKKSALSLAVSAAFALAFSLPAQAIDDDDVYEVAPNTGWAAMNGGTTGGQGASKENTITVKNKAQLMAALAKNPGQPRIILVDGLIDGTEGTPFQSQADQKARMPINLPSNTTLIGASPAAKFINSQLTVKNVSNVIIRNIHMEAPWDEYPVWDPTDGPTGNWNSEYDAVQVTGSTNVWIDHNTFTDGSRTDDQAKIVNGMLQQHHDGLLDVINGSNYVTISFNVFSAHAKNMLIGNSDSRTTDRGKLKVTLHNNVFSNIEERSPRVRFGQVHSYNNYHIGRVDSSYVYSLGYSLGVGIESALLSQNNVFEVQGAGNDGCRIVKGYKGTTFKDTGSVLNGQPLTLGAACTFSPEIGWTPPYPVELLPPNDVKSVNIEAAGFDKL